MQYLIEFVFISYTSIHSNCYFSSVFLKSKEIKIPNDLFETK